MGGMVAAERLVRMDMALSISLSDWSSRGMNCMRPETRFWGCVARAMVRFFCCSSRSLTFSRFPCVTCNAKASQSSSASPTWRRAECVPQHTRWQQATAMAAVHRVVSAPSQT